MHFSLYQGDAVSFLKSIPDETYHSVVTDPPYGLSDHKLSDVTECLLAWLIGAEYLPKKRGFMGHAWDSWVPGPEVWREVFRVLKPGGHVAVFAGSRTHDLMSTALRLAGFECRDTIMWVYGSGFPKSMDVSKAIDKAAGAEREVVGLKRYGDGQTYGERAAAGRTGGGIMGEASARGPDYETAPATDAARQWQGWGTALKPAFEPILLFRKPLVGTVAENVLAHGTGALNIDGCRVGTETRTNSSRPRADRNGFVGGFVGGTQSQTHDHGRWPANLIHDGSEEVVSLFPDSNGSGGSIPNVKITGYGDKNVGTGKAEYFGGPRTKVNSGSGSAARFFYCAKASKSDRGEGNNHPTVKPVALMRYVSKLITPKGGDILDPFCGSGSTLVGGILEGFSVTGIDLDRDEAGNPLGYLDIANSRCLLAQIQAFDEQLESEEL